MALLTGSLWGCSAPLGKILASQGTDMMTVTFLRTIIVCVISGLWIVFSKGIRGVLAKREDLPFFFILGVFNTLLTGVGFLVSLKYLSVPVAVLIHYLFPVLTIVGEYFIFRELPTRKKILAATLVLLGLWVGMFQGGAAQDVEISFVGVFWGLVAVLGLAGQSIIGKIAAEKQFDYKILLFYPHVFGSICLGIIKLFYGGMNDILYLNVTEFFLISLIGILAGVMAYAAYYTSLRYISSSLASLLCTSEIIVGIGITAVALLSPPTIFEVAGAGIIIFAIGISVS